MASHHHHQCHCHLTPPTPPTTTTCYCTMCYTTTRYPTPSPPPSDPLPHSIPSHVHHHPPQTHLHAPPQTLHDYYPPTPQIHQKHQLFQKYHHQQQDTQETPPPLNPTVSSLVHRIAALESSLSLRRRKQTPGSSSSLRAAAARIIQTHFRAFLVRRSVTLRHLKDLAYIKSALNNLKSSVSNKTYFDPQFLYRESMNLLIKLDSIQGSDPMIRDGKRSISRELIKFMELIDEIATEGQLISVKNVRFGKKGKKSVILQREHKIRASGARVFGGDNEIKLPENVKNRIKQIRVSSVAKVDEKEDEEGRAGVLQNRIGGLMKNQLKVKKNVSFDENGNVYRLIKSNHKHVSSDDNESSNGDEEDQVEEIGVCSKETEVVEEEDESSDMSENEMDPRKNLGSRIHNMIKKSQPNQENGNDDDDDDDDGEDDDDFVFSAPLPAKMEYGVDSVNKKQNAKH